LAFYILFVNAFDRRIRMICYR